MNGVAYTNGDHGRTRDEQFLTESKREERRLWIDLALIFPNVVFLLLKTIYEFFIPNPLKDVRGQLALITGGANGIGREIAINLARHGCNIAIVDIDLSMGNKTASELKLMGIDAKAYKTDVSKSDDIDLLKSEIMKDMGVVDILVNNAGVFFCKSPEEETVENLQRMININLMSNFWVNLIVTNAGNLK